MALLLSWLITFVSPQLLSYKVNGSYSKGDHSVEIVSLPFQKEISATAKILQLWCMNSLPKLAEFWRCAIFFSYQWSPLWEESQIFSGQLPPLIVYPFTHKAFRGYLFHSGWTSFSSEYQNRFNFLQFFFFFFFFVMNWTQSQVSLYLKACASSEVILHSPISAFLVFWFHI